jgi:SRSO17 transposase
LDEYDVCFGRSEPQAHLNTYVRGQLLDLPRKSIEPIALANDVRPRTLQEFLGTDIWDEQQMRDRLQQLVARDHLQLDSIGMIDDSGHAKCGSHTACVSRQYSGRSGKVDNCVVTVNLSLASFDTRFRVMLDSVPFLPEGWDQDQARRRRAHIPDDVRYRPKYDIALEELDRARDNGIVLPWLAADCWYGQKPKFLAGLHRRGQRFVVEIPCNFRCWSYDPSSAKRVQPSKEVRNLARYSRHMMRQPWTRVYLKDTQKGPLVWEAKAMPVWVELEGQVTGPWWLVWARDVTDPSQEKFFLSNASAGVPFEVILHVGFARWPIERCLQDEKSELGMSHFEVRKYPSICRHLIVTMVSHLFLSRQTERLRGEKSGDHHLPSAGCDANVDQHVVAVVGGSATGLATPSRDRSVLPGSQRRGPRLAHKNRSPRPRPSRHRPKKSGLMQAAR